MKKSVKYMKIMNKAGKCMKMHEYARTVMGCIEMHENVQNMHKPHRKYMVNAQKKWSKKSRPEKSF